MDNLDPNIRNTVRAVIIHGSRILLLRKRYEDGSERFVLPGGAQAPGEPLTTALARECQEEIGTTVRSSTLLKVADCFKQRGTVPPSTRHIVEFLFACEVENEYEPRNGHHPDRHQVEVLWVDLDELKSIPVHPPAVVDYLQDIRCLDANVYLGVM